MSSTTLNEVQALVDQLKLAPAIQSPDIARQLSEAVDRALSAHKGHAEEAHSAAQQIAMVRIQAEEALREPQLRLTELLQGVQNERERMEQIGSQVEEALRAHQQQFREFSVNIQKNVRSGTLVEMQNEITDIAEMIRNQPEEEENAG